MRFDYHERGPEAWVCDNCVNTPGYFNDYFLYKLNQLASLEEVL